MSKTKASQFFHLSRNTINLWLQRKEHTGDFLPKPNRPPGHNHQITDWHKFKAFAQEHGDKTSAQMAQLWDDDISPRTISRTLKKIGFTRKQLTATKNVISNSERSLLLRLNIWSRKGWFTSMKLA
ncbi:putative transposase [Arthrospira platensis NIES-39]|nr:putative transposase [Arthrospira platensis NIES-39]